MTRKLYERNIYTRAKQTKREVYDRKNNVLPTDNVKFTINTTPADAVAILTYEGVAHIAKSIVVDAGKKVEWEVSKEHYVTQTGEETVNETKTIDVTLVEDIVTLTITPTPDTATVTLTAEGYTQEGNAISVHRGTEVAVKVEAENYVTHESTETVVETKTLEITLDPVETEE